MLGNMEDVLNMVKQLQERLKVMTVKVSAGNGAVQLTMNGNQEVVQLNFKPEMAGSTSELARLTTEAFNEGMRESKKMVREELSRITGGISIPYVPGLL